MALSRPVYSTPKTGVHSQPRGRATDSPPNGCRNASQTDPVLRCLLAMPGHRSTLGLVIVTKHLSPVAGCMTLPISTMPLAGVSLTPGECDAFLRTAMWHDRLPMISTRGSSCYLRLAVIYITILEVNTLNSAIQPTYVGL